MNHSALTIDSRRRRALRTTCTAITVALLLAGCGQKGSLYLPDRQPSAVTPPPSPPPAAPAATPASPAAVPADPKPDENKDGTI